MNNLTDTHQKASETLFQIELLKSQLDVSKKFEIQSLVNGWTLPDNLFEKRQEIEDQIEKNINHYKLQLINLGKLVNQL